MGIGIWSMHFIGMLAFSVEGIEIYYDVPLMMLSIVVAVLASALALYTVSSREISSVNFMVGTFTMGAAIAGMHYIGIWSMKMAAKIHWDWSYVVLSILIAIIASSGALFMAFWLRSDLSLRGFLFRGLGGVLMGFAISGMHYTGMAAMMIIPTGGELPIQEAAVLATDGLAASVIVATVVILGIALSGSNVERALSKKTYQNEILQASLDSLDEFFSIASHELKTPLTSIKLQNDLLIRALQNNKFDLDKILNILEKNGMNIDRINRLVDDMLDTSRVSTGKLTLQTEKCELSTIVSDVVARFRPVLQQADCSVSFVSTVEIEGEYDRYRLEQVFSNLLSNAAKYAAGSAVVVKVVNGGESAEVSIKDFGTGISEKDQAKIFNRFERANSEGDMRGLGLGLFISKEIIEMHNGSIEVQSKLGEGAEFIVKLPVNSSHPAASA